jgi:RNA polymerase sigma factor (sigma-70 family)
MREQSRAPRDKVLLAQIQADDAEAFGLLFDRHHHRAFRHSLRLTPRAAQAEDLVAMVFLEAWRKRQSLSIVDGSVLPWLLVTANNLARNLHRAERRYERFLTRLPAPPVEPDPAQDVADRLDAERRGRDLTEAFQLLSDSDRDILTLCVLEQMPTATAATVLGIPPGTVKSRLSRAKARLAGMIPHLDPRFRLEGSLS